MKNPKECKINMEYATQKSTYQDYGYWYQWAELHQYARRDPFPLHHAPNIMKEKGK